MHTLILPQIHASSRCTVVNCTPHKTTLSVVALSQWDGLNNGQNGCPCSVMVIFKNNSCLEVSEIFKLYENRSSDLVAIPSRKYLWLLEPLHYFASTPALCLRCLSHPDQEEDL